MAHHPIARAGSGRAACRFAWSLAFAVAFGALPLLACGGGGDDGVTRWRFALEEIEGSVQDRYARRFAELLEERSGGEIGVTIYPYGALGTSSQLTEQVQTGALQLAFASPGHLGAVVPEVQVFSLHFIFSPDNRVNARVLGGSERLHELLSEAYRERGLELLAIVPEGWMAWTADRALRRVEDFQGLKIRTMSSPLLLAAYRAYGANPTPMPYSEVYSALQLNMIDAQVNPVFAIEEMSFYEVQDYLTRGRHAQFVSTVVTSPDFYAGLSEERRATLQEVKRQLDTELFEIQEQLNAERLEVIRESGQVEIVELAEGEREDFRKASLPVRDTYVELAGPRGRKILDTLLSEIRETEQAMASEPPAEPSSG